MNIIFGASGHAKEIDLFLSQNYSGDGHYNRLFVVDSHHANKEYIDDSIVTEGEFENVLISKLQDVYPVYLAIGNGRVRQKIVEKFKTYSTIEYPNFIPNVILSNSKNIELGEGNIMFPSAFLTIDTVIENHNHFNLGVSISHDCRIGSYNTFSPGVRISGNVQIGNNNFFGVGACVIDKIIIANNVVIGAGAVVTCNLDLPGTYVGVPAKRIS